MKHRLLIRITQSAAFYYRDQLIKSPISFPLRRIFTGLVGAVALAGLAAPAPASAAEPTIPIIVKDTTSGFWRILLGAAREARQELRVREPELGAQTQSDINRQS